MECVSNKSNPKMIIVDYFDDQINKIDIEAERALLDDSNEKLNNYVDSTRTLFINQVEQIKKINLEKYSANENKIESKLKVYLESSDLEEKDKKLNELYKELFVQFCVYLNQEHFTKLTSKNNKFYFGKILITDFYLNPNVLKSYIQRSEEQKSIPIENRENYRKSRVAKDVFNEEFAITSSLIHEIQKDTDIEKNVFLKLYRKQFIESTELNIRDQLFTSIDSNAFFSFKNIKFLDFTSNNITSIDSNILSELVNMTFLNLSYNQITTIDKCAFQNLKNLNFLFLNHNRLNKIEMTLFEGLLNLEYIDLSSNQFVTIGPNLFTGLINLCNIHFYDNKIEDVHPDTFQNLPNLRYINLSRNKIKFVNPKVFKNLLNLQIIHLNLNQITFIDPETFSDLPSIRIISLQGNYNLNEEEKIRYEKTNKFFRF